jgi:hypothetical protein
VPGNAEDAGKRPERTATMKMSASTKELKGVGSAPEKMAGIGQHIEFTVTTIE